MSSIFETAALPLIGPGSYRFSIQPREIFRRGISFEEVHTAIDEGGLLDVIQNPDPEQPGGLMYVVFIREYTWVVPFHQHGDTIILHTAFPDRRMMRKYGFR